MPLTFHGYLTFKIEVIMKKNIWALLAVGVCLNMAVFAGNEAAKAEEEVVPAEKRAVANVDSNDETVKAEEEAASTENRVAVYVNYGDETASTEGDESPVSNSLACGTEQEEEEEQDLKSFLVADDSSEEEEKPAESLLS